MSAITALTAQNTTGVTGVTEEQISSMNAVNVQNLVIWVIGFAAYRILMRVDTPVGNTLPDMVLTVLLCLVVSAVRGKPQTTK